MYGYGYGYYSMFDPTMILVLIGVFLSLGASAKVKSTYARFSRVRSMTGMTGARGGETAFKFTGNLRCADPPGGRKSDRSL